MIKTSDYKAVLEQVQADYENRSVLLDRIPEIDPFSGNPKRGILEQLINNSVELLKGNLSLPVGALEAGDSTTSGVPSVTGDILPILYRFFPDEIAFDLVTTQPMNNPTGLAMWLNEKYGSADADGSPDTISVGNRMDQYKDRDYSTETTEGEDAAKYYFDISSATLNTVCKKLKAHVTPQAMQDYAKVTGLNTSTVVADGIARALRREIGLTIIYQLLTYAGAGNVNWSSSAPSGSTVLNIQAHKATLWEAVVDANNLVYDAIYKQPNWIIGNTTNIGRFVKIAAGKFEVNPLLKEQPNLASARHLAGTLETGQRVYVDPWFPSTTKMLVGYKGMQWQDAGAGFFPYIPLWWTPDNFYDPDDGGKYKRLALSRYGKISSADSTPAIANTCILDANYFATITVTSS